MNAPSKNYFLNKEDYLTLKAHWAQHHWQSGAKEMIIYNILRSKPARNGFTTRKKNIQGNDPWFGFREALKQAFYYTYEANSPWVFWGARFVDDREEHRKEMEQRIRERFKERFGIELSPPDLYDALREAAVELKEEQKNE